MELNDLRVVVLTHGAGGEYGPLLDSLAAAGLPPDRAVVVHNPSEPGQAPPPVPDGYELIAAPRNLGYTGGMNLGLERQLGRDGEFVLVLTHDARFRPGGLEALIEAARADASYGVLGPALVLQGTEEVFSFGGFTRPDGVRSHTRERPAGDAPIAPCDWIDGGTMLFRADLLRRIGPFEDRFFIYCEDSEICLRATRAGAGVGVVPAALADQAPGGGKRLGPWSYMMTRNGAFYTRAACGRPGLRRMMTATAKIVAINALRVIARGSGLRKGSPSEPWALTVGTARGAIDYFRGRWGPPPTNLPSPGDVGNA